MHKTLIILAHPNLEQSRINKTWFEAINQTKEFSINQLYINNPNWTFDIKKEQDLLLEHENIVFQFPVYWYSCPPLLKKYFDDIFEYGFAYGSNGDKLKGKKFTLAVSFGAQEDYFTPSGAAGVSLQEVFKPLELTAKFSGMIFTKFFTIFGASYNLSDNELTQSKEEYLKFLKSL